VDETARVNADYYVTNLIPKLVEDATALIPDGFIFQQDDDPAHTAHATQDLLHVKCSDFIAKDEWHQTRRILMRNSTWLSCVGCHAESLS